MLARRASPSGEEVRILMRGPFRTPEINGFNQRQPPTSLQQHVYERLQHQTTTQVNEQSMTQPSKHTITGTIHAQPSTEPFTSTAMQAPELQSST